jgi:hypothetical protein
MRRDAPLPTSYVPIVLTVIVALGSIVAAISLALR